MTTITNTSQADKQQSLSAVPQHNLSSTASAPGLATWLRKHASNLLPRHCHNIAAYTNNGGGRSSNMHPSNCMRTWYAVKHQPIQTVAETTCVATFHQLNREQ
jgi:hypothetical protein